jgi:hypothetical protein
MYPNTDDCILITATQYLDLVNPRFVGQTSIDKNNMYYMVFECEGINYATHNKL